MHRRLTFVFAVALLASFIGTASGSLLFYDSFNYSAGSLGTAGSPTWTKVGGSTADPTVQNAGGLTFPGLATSGDSNNVQYDGSGIGAPAASDDVAIPGGPYSTGTLYYSLLVKVPTVQVSGGNGFSTGTNLTFGSFMAGFQTVSATTNPATNTTLASLLIRSGDATQTSTTYQLGTSITTNNADRTFYTVSNGPATNYSTGASAETVFVVMKYTFDPTTNANETSKMFINPTPGGAEPGSPQVTATYDAALVRNTGIASFFVRNNSVEPDVLWIDELRIGTTWEDVTPAVPEPMTAALGLVGVCLPLLLRRRR
jgi:MYXO-CTERM domain-containing protein